MLPFTLILIFLLAAALVDRQATTHKLAWQGTTIVVPKLRRVCQVVTTNSRATLYSLPIGVKELKRGWYLVSSETTLYFPYTLGKVGLQLRLRRILGTFTME